MTMMTFAIFFFFKQKTAYEMRICDWSSDVCSSDLHHPQQLPLQTRHLRGKVAQFVERHLTDAGRRQRHRVATVDACAQCIEPDQPIGRASCRESVCQYV